MSAGNSPRSVITARTRPSSVRIAVTVCSSANRAPRSIARRPIASIARTLFASPSVGTRYPPRIRSRSSSGHAATHSSESRRRPSTPHDVANPRRRLSSSSRSGVVASSSPPTCRKHHCPSSWRALYFSTVYAAYSVIALEPFVWNTRPGACEDEPPAAHRRPWSRTVTSVQPRSVSSSARPAPTIPAPMMTTRGDAIAPPVWCRLKGCRAFARDRGVGLALAHACATIAVTIVTAGGWDRPPPRSLFAEAAAWRRLRPVQPVRASTSATSRRWRRSRPWPRRAPSCSCW